LNPAPTTVVCRPLRRELDGTFLPHAADIAMLLQMIVGAWPLDLMPQTAHVEVVLGLQSS